MKVINNNNPLFALVCGFEHSGTTLVSEILRQHPQLDSGFEGGFLLNNEAKEFLTTEPFYTNSKKGWGLKDEDLSYICNGDNWAEVYLRIRERAEVIKNKNVSLFDKTPRYMQKLPNVLERVPDIPCIVIVKDIRSVFWSSYKRAKMTMDEWHKKIFKRTCNHTLSYAKGWKEAIEKGLEKRILLIKYEELCLDQKTEVKKIFDFLGLEFQESYLTFNNPKYNNVYGGEISTQYLTEYKGNLPEYICEEILELTSEYSDWLWSYQQTDKSGELLPSQASMQIKSNSNFSEENTQKQAKEEDMNNFNVENNVEKCRANCLKKPHFARSYFDWGIALLESKRFLEAQGVIHKAIELNPAFSDSSIVFTKYHEHLEIAFEQCKDWAWPAVQLGAGLIRQRKFTEAESYLFDIVENRIPFEKITYCRGFQYLCQLIFSQNGTNDITAKIIKEICLKDIERHGQQPWSSLYLGAALKVTGQLEEAYQYFQRAADSISLFNHAGKGCFSCKNYNILFNQTSDLNTSSWISKFLSKIEFHNQDKRFQDKKLVLFICSDSKYFQLFSEIFAKSCLLQDSDVACHFHIVNPESETFDYYSELQSLLPGLPLALSFEKIDIVNVKAYYSMVRFVRINELLNHYNKSVLMVDSDSVITGNISSLTNMLNSFDICLSFKHNDNYFPWRSIPAGLVFASNNDATKLFFAKVRQYLDLVFKPNEEGDFWWIDQNALFATYEYCRKHHPSIQFGNIEDIGVKSVFSFALNDSRKKQEFIANHKAKLEKLEKITQNSAREVELVTTEYGSFYGFKNDTITEQLKQFGAHCRNELAMLLNFIQVNDFIIDVGAHIGTFAIPFGLKVGPNGRVYAFEANPDNYSNLSKNIEINNLEEIVLSEYGIVTNQPGQYTLKKGISGNSGTYYFQLEEKETKEKENSICISIDQWYKNQKINQLINLIKIETEGFELNVLKSAKNLVKSQKPIIYAEINRVSLSRLGQTMEDMETFLDELGYHFFRNSGKRNSKSDEYNICRLQRLRQGGDFYDLLAVHPDHPHYPNLN